MSIEVNDIDARIEQVKKLIEKAKTRSTITIIVFAVALVGSTILAYQKGAENERSESTAVSVLIAKADSNIVALQQVAKADSTKANDAGLNIIYWRGVKDAFLSLDADEVRVFRSAFGGK